MHLATPSACPQLVGEVPPPDAYFTAEELLRQWILLASGATTLDDLEDHPQRAWLSLPTAEQAAWVRTTYDQFAGCRLDDAAPPQP